MSVKSVRYLLIAKNGRLFKSALLVKKMVGKLLERLNNVCQRGNGGIVLALFSHMLLADNKSIMLAVYHPVISHECLFKKQV